MSRKVIIFAPHPDDETYGCGGTIAKKINEGYEVFIVIMTDGRYLYKELMGIDFDPSPEVVKEIRREEILRATKILGVLRKNLFFLDFIDGTLEEHEKEAEIRIFEIIKGHPPCEVYFPNINDCHPDHRATNRVVKSCLQKLGLTPVNYQYFILHKYAHVGPLIERVLSLFRKNRVEVDVSEFLILKEKALMEFKSDLSLIARTQNKPLEEGIKKYLNDKETFYIDI